MQDRHPYDEPFPPARKVTRAGGGNWDSLIFGGFILMLVVGLAGLTKPLLSDLPVSHARTETISNAREIGRALLAFEKENGTFPDAETIVAVQAKTSTDLDLGKTTSSDFFRQLVASGLVGRERMFRANIPGSRMPDEVMTKGRALEKGECGFAYLLGLGSSGNPSRPLVVGPVIPNTDRFDPKPFRGSAIILQVDGSVSVRPIDKDGHVNVMNQNILNPTNAIWDGKPPVVVWPDL